MAGAPIAQAQMPKLLNQKFLERGTATMVVPLHIAKSGLQNLLRAMCDMQNVVGLLVTIPHKQQLCNLSQFPSARARLLGFANVVRLNSSNALECDCLDGDALMTALLKRNFSPQGTSALVVGSGGAGAAYAAALVQSGARIIDLFDTDFTRCESLATRLRLFDDKVKINVLQTLESHSQYNLVVNASPAGMYAIDECSIPNIITDSAQFVVDATTPTWTTQIIQRADLNKIPQIEGKELAAAQIDSLLSYFAI